MSTFTSFTFLFKTAISNGLCTFLCLLRVWNDNINNAYLKSMWPSHLMVHTVGFLGEGVGEEGVGMRGELWTRSKCQCHPQRVWKTPRICTSLHVPLLFRVQMSWGHIDFARERLSRWLCPLSLLIKQIRCVTIFIICKNFYFHSSTVKNYFLRDSI